MDQYNHELKLNAYRQAMAACEIAGIEIRMTGRMVEKRRENPLIKWNGLAHERCEQWELVFRDGKGDFLTYSRPCPGFVNRMAEYFINYIKEEL